MRKAIYIIRYKYNKDPMNRFTLTIQKYNII